MRCNSGSYTDNPSSLPDESSENEDGPKHVCNLDIVRFTGYGGTVGYSSVTG